MHHLKIRKMQYTKYFSGMINSYGSLNFQPDQLKVIMNLIHLEGKIEGIKALEKRYKANYNLELKTLEGLIKQITIGLSPGELVNKWKVESD